MRGHHNRAYRASTRSVTRPRGGFARNVQYAPGGAQPHPTAALSLTHSATWRVYVHEQPAAAHTIQVCRRVCIILYVCDCSGSERLRVFDIYICLRENSTKKLIIENSSLIFF